MHNVRLLPFVEMDVARQRALARASAAARKQKEKKGASSGVIKGTSKRKSDGKDDCLLKKGPGIPAGDKKPKQCCFPSLAMEQVMVS